MNTKYYVPLLVAAALFARTASAAFCWDDADSDLDQYYRTYEQYMGYSEGMGFEPWLALHPGWGSGGSYLVQQGLRPGQPAIQLDYSWGMNGTYAVGRGLLDELSSGTWSFLATHHVINISNMGFSGFNLKSVKSKQNASFSEGELIRFGFNDWTDYKDNSYYKGICYSTDGGSTYRYVGGGIDWAGARLQYSVSWNGQGTYTLIVENLDSEDEPIRKTIHTALQSGPVAMLGTAIYGDDLNAGSIVFDAYEVIPEPAGAMPVLALTVFAMALRRNR